MEKCYIIPVQKENELNKDKTDNTLSILNYNNKFILNLSHLRKREVKYFKILSSEDVLLNEKLDLIISTIKKIIPDSKIKLNMNSKKIKYFEEIDEINILPTERITLDNYSESKKEFEKRLKKATKYYTKNQISTTLDISEEVLLDKSKSVEIMTIIKNYTNKMYYTFENENYYKEFSENNLYDFKFKKIYEKKENESNDYILATNNIIYSDFNFKILKARYSYLLLKPDSEKILNEIEKIINKNKFEIVKKIMINDFKRNSLVLYNGKDEEFIKKIKENNDIICNNFSNKGLILFLNKNIKEEELIKDTHDLKLELREEYKKLLNKWLPNNNICSNLVHFSDCFIKNLDRDYTIIMNIPNKEIISENRYKEIKKIGQYK